MDKLNGLLSDSDFERIYQRIKEERRTVEEQLKEAETEKKSPAKKRDKAKELVQTFLDSAFVSRELLVSLIERVELTEDKKVIIRFRFKQLEQ